MGPVRRKQFTRALTVLVSADLVAGVGALCIRSATAGAIGRRPAAAPVADQAAPTGMLGVGHFSHRRVIGTATTAPAATAVAAAPVTTGRAPAPAGILPVPSPKSTATPPAAPGPASGPPSSAPPSDPQRADGAPAPASPAPAGSAVQPVLVDDPAGDTVVDGSGASRAEPAADIVSTRAAYQSGAIVLAVGVRQPSDPAQDPHWASDNTYLVWEIDTNGDGTPDFQVQYFLDSGAPVAGVSHPNDTDAASLCPTEAGYSAAGYTVAFDPACVGRPASFAYRVTIYYDTNPKNEDADVVTDVAPNGGLSRPVARPAG